MRSKRGWRWWTAYPARVPIVTGWCGGPSARALSQLPAGDLASRAIGSLSRQLRIRRQRLRSLVEAAWTHDWEHDPFARGAYSYQTVDGSSAPAMLARPLRQTLFFAGEATDAEAARLQWKARSRVAGARLLRCCVPCNHQEITELRAFSESWEFSETRDHHARFTRSALVHVML
jgi:hypothetical protein